MVAQDAEPLGYFAAMLLARTDRLRALFISAFGNRNAVPCEHCEQMYLYSTVRQAGDTAGDSEAIHSRYPFVLCISVPGYARGACANCVYHVRSNCSFSLPENEELPLISAVRAIDEDSDEGTVFTDTSGRGYFRAGEARLRPRPRFPQGMEVDVSIEDAILQSVQAEFRAFRRHRDPKEVARSFVDMYLRHVSS
ncbi:hypothetical protein GE09DRAFT_1067024 [Coniochaeta sp. 2T2.1]|nr:hypothetical protein GE09DRAFT_1067024 [Coniochaeta sp. 2T2.1]